jgi:predicted nucleotide-binding protein (sugar kinase/HSP70/actin superfamily)
MLVGKALHAYHHHTAHMVCELSPYSCMPNTMSIGAMANVLGKYPDLLYAPIEIKGDAEIHALSRCQMILTEAKKRAQQEYEQVIQQTELSPDQVHQYEAQNPKIKKVTTQIPHNNVAGTAARYVLNLAGKV